MSAVTKHTMRHEHNSCPPLIVFETAFNNLRRHDVTKCSDMPESHTEGRNEVTTHMTVKVSNHATEHHVRSTSDTGPPNQVLTSVREDSNHSPCNTLHMEARTYLDNHSRDEVFDAAVNLIPVNNMGVHGLPERSWRRHEYAPHKYPVVTPSSFLLPKMKCSL